MGENAVTEEKILVIIATLTLSVALSAQTTISPNPNHVNGSGTANYVPRWVNPTTLGNSALYQATNTANPQSARIGLGTITPLAKLDVRYSNATGPAILGFNNSTATGSIPVGIVGVTPAPMGVAIQGFATNTTSSGSVGTVGVYGQADAPVGFGVFGQATSNAPSPCSPCPAGVLGITNLAGAGVVAVALNTTGISIALQAEQRSPQGFGAVISNVAGGDILVGNGPGFVPKFRVDGNGNVFIAGNLTKGSGSFKIDHPLDPANKYLSHSFVESPDMMNIYNGNIVTDSHGLATVVLPDYFSALNADFRYQLTVIGQFAQAIVAQEIDSDRFTIKTDKPSVKVSWQVTGVRQDAYAKAHRIRVEEEKAEQERGHYLHPELFGAREQDAIGASTEPAFAEPNVPMPTVVRARPVDRLIQKR